MELVIPKRRPRGGFSLAPRTSGRYSSHQILTAGAKASGMSASALLTVLNRKAKGSYPRYYWQGAVSVILWNECPHLSGEMISRLFNVDRDTLFSRLASVRRAPMLFAYCTSKIYEEMEAHYARTAKATVRGTVGGNPGRNQKVDAEPHHSPH